MNSYHRDITTKQSLAWQAVCALLVADFGGMRETRNPGKRARPCDG